MDSREKHPYSFEHVQVVGLETGDYSVIGLESSIAVERKSKADMYGTLCGVRRERFQRELTRMSAMLDAGGFACIIIEATVKGFLRPPAHSQLHPHAAIGSMLAFMARYRVPVIWAGDREYGNAVVWKLLEFSWQQAAAREKAARGGT